MTSLREKYILLIKYSESRGWGLGSNPNNDFKQGTFGCDESKNQLVFNTGGFDIWDSYISEECDNNKLLNYFFEVIRRDLPKLIGTTVEVYFGYSSTNKIHIKI